MKRRMVLATTALMLSFAICRLPATTQIRQFLPSVRENENACVLPVDKVIGMTADNDSSEIHILMAKALATPYSFEWTETYIDQSVRSSIVNLFGPWFSENLGSVDFILSVSHQNADGSIGINVRAKDSCMAFVLMDSKIISMSRLISKK